MANHPNRSQISQVQWLDADDNQQLCNDAGYVAHDALRGHFDARDLVCPVTREVCKSQAEDIAFAGRRGWYYAAADENDPAGEIAKKVLAANGFCLRSGIIGFDATIAPILV